MVDLLAKELFNIFYYSDVNSDRSTTKSVRINGRLYDKHGIDCAVSAIALLYKVYDPSINHNKYVILIGAARQNPYDTVIDEDTGYELAMENTLINPAMTVEYNDKVDDDVIYSLLTSYVSGLPVQFVKTKTEIELEGKNVKDYNRGIDNSYYDNYYKDFLKIFSVE